MSDLIPVAQVAAGEITRREFGAESQENRAETAIAAVTAREKAAVEARYIMAVNRPRSIESFRLKLLAECKRLGFAEAAEYERPVGKEYNQETRQWEQKIARGPSIRLIESAIRAFGNLSIESPVIFDNEEIRIVRCVMTDLESNSTWMQDEVIQKRVDKRGFKNKTGGYDPPQGREVVGQRTNSSGDITFVVVATDDEVKNRQSQIVSKTQRKNGERILPGDIIHEAILLCRETIKAGDDADPAAAVRRMLDAFQGINIQPEHLAQLLGKPVDRIQPADLKMLRGVYTMIRDQEATFEEILDSVTTREGSRGEQSEVLKNKLASMGKPAEKQADPTPEESRLAGLAAYQRRMGAEKFYKVLGSLGFEKPEEVIQEKLIEVIAALEAELPPAPAAEEPVKETPAKKPLFGSKDKK